MTKFGDEEGFSQRMVKVNNNKGIINKLSDQRQQMRDADACIFQKKMNQ